MILKMQNIRPLQVCSNFRKYTQKAASKPCLTLYTKNNCPLCDEAKLKLTSYSQYVCMSFESYRSYNNKISYHVILYYT